MGGLPLADPSAAGEAGRSVSGAALLGLDLLGRTVRDVERLPRTELRSPPVAKVLAQCTYSEGAVFVTRPMPQSGQLRPGQKVRNSSKEGSNEGSGSRNARQRGTASAAGPVPMIRGVPLAKASGIAIQPRFCS